MAQSKLRKPLRKLWSKESMAAAVQSVEDGMGVREASRLYNLPFETLRRRTSHLVSLDCAPGPPTVLSKEEEEELVSYCIKMADMGFGLSREDVMVTAFRIAESSGRKHPFSNGIAGRSWLDGFRSRHPNLTMRSAQSLSHSRAACSNEYIIQDYFAKLGAICARMNILSKPMQIFNMDETGLSIVHKPGRVFAEIGRRNVWALTSAEKGKTHTVLTCVSATGFCLPPFMIYPRKRITEALKVGALPGTVFRCSDSGWVTGELFLEWLQFFADMIPPARPALLILDGHASHISIDVIELAQANQIHMLCLPAHTTHLLQPLDVGVFKSLKAHYYKACKKYITDHPGRVITTDVIASLLAAAWPQSVTPVNVMGGFKKSGVYPLNPGEINDRDLAPSKATQSTKSCSPSEDVSVPSADLPEDLVLLYQRRFEEGYDIYDEKYVAWLHNNHPDSIPSSLTGPSVPSPTSNSGDPSTGSVKSSQTSHLSEILALPQPKAPTGKQRRKKGSVNSKATSITDMSVLQDLKEKKNEKIEKEKEKEERILERQRKKEKKEKEKEERILERQRKKVAKERISKTSKVSCTRRRTTKKKSVDVLKEHMQKMCLSDSTSETESEAECPECGLIYGADDGSTWIQCDCCQLWWDLQCAGVSVIPDSFCCPNCK